MSNFPLKKKLIRKKKLCRPTVPNVFGDVSGNNKQFFLRLTGQHCTRSLKVPLS